MQNKNELGIIHLLFFRNIPQLVAGSMLRFYAYFSIANYTHTLSIHPPTQIKIIKCNVNILLIALFFSTDFLVVRDKLVTLIKEIQPIMLMT